MRHKKKLLISTTAAVCMAIVAFLFIPGNAKTGESLIDNLEAFPKIRDADKKVQPIPVRADNMLCGNIGRLNPDGTETIFGSFEIGGQDWFNVSEAVKEAELLKQFNLLIDGVNAKISSNNDSMGLVTPARADWTYECPECGGGSCCEAIALSGSYAGGVGNCMACAPNPECITLRWCCQLGADWYCGSCSVYGCWGGSE